jgi:hypothetical protein
LKDLKSPAKNGARVDVPPNIAPYTLTRTEIVQRLNAEKCEYCGQGQGYFEVHHMRKLKDLHGKEHWQQVMASMQRSTVPTSPSVKSNISTTLWTRTIEE